jgi:pimeloyl-ACP methyl ester carboxylesterase
MDFSLDAVSVTLEGVGHLAPIEAPRETAAAMIDFLTKVRVVSC